MTHHLKVTAVGGWNGGVVSMVVKLMLLKLMMVEVWGVMICARGVKGVSRVRAWENHSLRMT